MRLNRGGRAVLVGGALVIMITGFLYWSKPGDDAPVAAESVRVVSGRRPDAGPPLDPSADRLAAPTPNLGEALDGIPLVGDPPIAISGAEEPPDPTLYSDDRAWSNSWVAVDGVLQPPPLQVERPRQEVGATPQ